MFQLSITSFLATTTVAVVVFFLIRRTLSIYLFIYHEHLCLINKIFICMNHAESSTISTAIVRLFVANDPHSMSASEEVNSNRAKWVKVTRPCGNYSYEFLSEPYSVWPECAKVQPNSKLCPQQIKTDPIKIIGHRFACVAGATQRRKRRRKRLLCYFHLELLLHWTWSSCCAPLLLNNNFGS